MVNEVTYKPQTLNAFYDLGVSSNSFDILCFLVVAELARLEEGLEKINVIIVPPSKDFTFPENLYNEAQESWRINNVLVASCWLLETCEGVTVAESREQVADILRIEVGKIFPQGYRVDKPISKHHTAWPIIAAHEGKNLQFLRASEQAKAYARQWLESHCEGKKAVALTLREAKFTPERNSKIKMWDAFAQNLIERGFFPVVLHDIETALEAPKNYFTEIAKFPEAVFNLDLRIAFYEECYICAFVSNGPSTPCYFNKSTHYLYFVTGEWLHERPGPSNRVGLQHGVTPPFANRFQRWIWKDQNEDLFIEELTDLDKSISDSKNKGTYESDSKPLALNREPTLLVAERISNWMGSLDAPLEAPLEAELNILSYLLEKEGPNSDNDAIIHRLRGIQSLRLGDTDSAFKNFEAAIDLSGDEKSLLQILRAKDALLDDNGVIEICVAARKLGLDSDVFSEQEKEAKNNLTQIANLNFAHMTKRAELFIGNNLAHRAEEILTSAYSRHDRRGMLSQLATIYQVMGDHQKSANTFRRAVDEGYCEPIILFRFGVELIAANELRGAIAVFESLRDRNIENDSITLALGQLYESIGQPGDALDCYRKAQEKGVNNPEIDDRAFRLRNSIPN